MDQRGLVRYGCGPIFLQIYLVDWKKQEETEMATAR